MPTINLRDGRNRDALVGANSTSQYAKVDYVDKDGAKAKTRKVLKATAEMNFDRLVKSAGDDGKLGEALVAGDGDVDFERIGMFLSDTSRVFVNEKDEIVYQIEQVEIVRGPDGVEKERRPRKRAEPNVEAEIPIGWTGRMVKKEDALRRFAFSGKLQIVHVNGLTYDFLYGMAKELHEAKSLMLLGAGKSSKEPLIFRRGTTPHRGFLEGRIDGDKYMLILHLSKLELKRPVVVASAEAAVAAVAQVAAPVQPVASVPPPAPVLEPVPVPVAAEPRKAETAEPRKPTVKEVLAAVSEGAAEAGGARAAVGEAVASAKAAKQKKTKAAVSAKAAADGEAGEAAKPARKARAPKAKPVDKPAG